MLELAPQSSPTAKVAPEDTVGQTFDLALFGVHELQANILTCKLLTSSFAVAHNEPLIFDIVVLKKSLRLSILISELEGTPFNQLVLEDVVLTRQNFVIQGGPGVGLHFNGVLTIDKTSGDLHNLVSNVLGCKNPRIELYCGLGYIATWSQRPRISSFTLEGNLSDINVGDKFKLTSIGVKLFAFETSAISARGTVDGLKMNVGFGVYGTMSICLPRADHSVDVEFSMEKTSSSVQLSTTAHLEWRDAFGLVGVTLNEVQFSAMIELDQPLSTQIFEIDALFTFGNTKLALEGAFSPGGDFSLEADIENLAWDDIEILYSALFASSKEKPPRPAFDFELQRGVLIISNAGLSLTVSHLLIGDYYVTSGTIALEMTGIRVGGEIAGDALHIGSFTISNPKLALECFYFNGKPAADLIISGTLRWENFNFHVFVHVYPPSDKTETYNFTICGSFIPEDPKASLRFGRLISPLEGTAFGDITLDNAALVYASQDKAVLPKGMETPYELRKGLYICAQIGHLDVLEPFTPQGVSPNLKLYARWSKGGEFAVSIQSDDLAINLGGDFTCDPLTFDLVLGSSPAIRARCGFKLMLQDQEPLSFTLAGEVHPSTGDIELSASMNGLWVNPFDISPQLQVGDAFVSFKLLHGAPSAIIVGGRIKINDSDIRVTLGKGATPDEFFLSMHIENIGPKKIAGIANSLLQVELPEPPDVFFIAVADLYICPKDLRINGQAYSRGISFRANMFLFGKNVEAHFELSDSGFMIKGSMEPFSIGPLRVSGSGGTTTHAVFQLEIFKNRQFGHIDGAISLGNVLEAKIHSTISLLPHLYFDFTFSLAMFGDSLVINVVARTLQPLNPSSCDISNQRYSLHADFEQHLLSHMRGSIHKGLQKCAEELQAKADSAKKWVADTQREFSGALDELRDRTNDWKSGDEGKRNKFLETLSALIETHIRLNPKDMPPDAPDRVREGFRAYHDAKDGWELLNYSLKTSPIAELRDTPFVGKAIGFIWGTTTAIATNVSPDLRDAVKTTQLKFLHTQMEAVELVMSLLPTEAHQYLRPMADDVRNNLRREEANSSLDDIIEDLRDAAANVIGDILDVLLGLIQDISKAVAQLSVSVITLGNGISQAALRFADGVMMKILSLLDIKSIVFDAEIGAGDVMLKFRAAVVAILNGKEISFVVEFEVGDPTKFMQAVIDYLTTELKKLI
ncbi:hypothetical protein DL93DRAFT_2161004 [Clavulina sp. PMI_390]|nr:hypothetical protein DL93DRAFT_2161004 [Clavulina sp. PMI_390]